MAKKKAKNALIYLVLDRSGSMEPIRQATVDGCNQFLTETRTISPDARFSLLLFDTEITKPYVNVRISDIEPIDNTLYVPRGGTALLDAMGEAMSDIESLEQKPDKVVVIVMTDGGENSSHEYTRAAVKAAISRHETEDKWQIVFLGANIDAFAEAGAIGVARSASSTSWQPSSAGASAVYAMASTATNSYFTGASDTVDVDSSEYAINLASTTAGEAKPIGVRLREYKERKATTPKP